MAEQANPPDYYAILQVRPGAEPEVIKAAYQGLLTKYHFAAAPLPDAARKIVELKEAYEVLADPAKRAVYDAGRASGAAENQENFARTIPAKSVSPGGSGGRWVLTALFFVAAFGVPLWLAPDISNYLALAADFPSIAAGDLLLPQLQDTQETIVVFQENIDRWFLEKPVFFLLWFWANFLAAAFIRFGAGFVAGYFAVYGTSRMAPVRRLQVAGWVAFGIAMIALLIILRTANPETWIDGVSTLLLMAGAALGAWGGYKRLESELKETLPDPPDS